tara:strand:+ start:459 stop:806 length:348 start_codon:yes stop_codon:yes gene_type:complete
MKIYLTRSIDIEQSEIHRNFVGLRNCIGATSSKLTLFDKDDLILDGWTKDPRYFTLQNDWLMIASNTLVKKAEFTEGLSELRFEMFATLGGSGDLLLHPDYGKGAADNKRNHYEN